MSKKLFQPTELKLLDAITEYFQDLQLGMSEFQIKNFVLNSESFPLPDSKFYQAKLELYSRWQKLINLELDHKKALAEQMLEESKKLKWENVLDSELAYEKLEAKAQIELANVELERLEFRLRSFRKMANETIREIKVFMNVIEDLQPKLRYPDKEASEEEHWLTIQKLREQKNDIAKHQLPFKNKIFDELQ